MTTSTTNYREMQKFARSLRRTSATAIEHSGGKQTIFGCICGSRHTTSTDWNGRNAKHVIEWQVQHDIKCAKRFERIQARKSDDWMAAQRDYTYSDDNH